METIVNKKNQHGFTMVEVLCSLLITLLICSSVSSILLVVKNVPDYRYTDTSLEMAAYQIAATLHSSTNIEVGSSLAFTNEDDKECIIKLDRGRVVKTPGYTIYTQSVDSLNFYEQDRRIYMEIEYQNNATTFWIGSK